MDLSQEKWFSESPLSEEELLELDVHASQLVIPVGHPILRRIKLTLDGQNILAALSTIARLALPHENGPVVIDLLNMTSRSIERLAANMTSQELCLCDANLLQILILTNQGLRASDALILVNNSVKRCTRACSWILRSLSNVPLGSDDGGRPLRLVPASCRILHELASYKAFWSRKGGERSDKPMAELSSGFEKYVGTISEVVLQEEILDLLGLVMHRWCSDIVLEPQDATAFRFFPAFKSSLLCVLGFITNILTLTSSFTIAVRKHLANQTVLLHNVVLPLILFFLDAEERDVPGDHEKTLCALLRMLALAMFNVRTFRPWLARCPDIIQRVCRYASRVGDCTTVVEIAASTARLIINAELIESVGDMLAFVSGLSDSQQQSLARRLSNPKERGAPIQIFCQTYLSLRPIFALKDAVDQVAESVICKRTVQRRKRNRRRRERNQIRHRALCAAEGTLQQCASQGEPVVPPEGVDDDFCASASASDGGESVDNAPNATTIDLTTQQGEHPPTTKDWSRYRAVPPPPAGTPDRYICALTGRVMQIPVLSPYGDVFDKASILSFLKENGCRCPVTDEELFSTDLVVDDGLKRELDVVRFNYC